MLVFLGLVKQERQPDTEMRLGRAMKRLRELAPREHDVMHRVLSGEPPAMICYWLNARAIRGDHPERYSQKDTEVLISSGLHKLEAWY